MQRIQRNPKYVEIEDGSDAINYGINDTEQTPRKRGNIPVSNQPNHVINKWKVHHSHPGRDNMGRIETQFSSDLETPMWMGRGNMYLDDNSSMHLTSRFAGSN
jgi:hypothetical protein